MANNKKRQPSSAPRPRKRPVGVTIMVSEEERQEMRDAADQAELPLSMFLRLLTMAAIRRGVSVLTINGAEIAGDAFRPH
jgi:hypothetical protein